MEKTKHILGDTLYRKTSSGRYISVGPDLTYNTLQEGLWIIRKNGSSLTSVAHLLTQLEEYQFTVDDLATIETYEHYIIKNLSDKFSGKQMSLHEVLKFVLAEILYKCKY